MEEVANYNNFRLIKLTKSIAEEYTSQIIEMLNLIPKVDRHDQNDVLGETKGERILHKKWEHSLIAFSENNTLAGIIMGYEREDEKNSLYPSHSIYLSYLSVAKDFQNHGLGKFLVKNWLLWNTKIGFLALDGPLRFSVQTNSSPWNSHVQRLYESFGFEKISEKKYDNRIDNVYSLTP